MDHLENALQELSRVMHAAPITCSRGKPHDEGKPRAPRRALALRSCERMKRSLRLVQIEGRKQVAYVVSLGGA